MPTSKDTIGPPRVKRFYPITVLKNSYCNDLQLKTWYFVLLVELQQTKLSSIC